MALVHGQSVLIVDDEAAARRTMMRALTQAGYVCAQAASVDEARKVLGTVHIDLVVCDVRMPGGSGLDLIEEVARDHPRTEILMATSDDDPAVAAASAERGASGYLVKPISVSQLLIEIAHTLRTASRHQAETAKLERSGRAADRDVQRLKTALDESSGAHDDQAATVFRMAEAVGLRDVETGSHIQRIGEYARALAELNLLDVEACERIGIAAPLHDIGKIAIPDSILLKPGKLEPREREAMQTHTTIGSDILAGTGSDLLDLAALIALTHHERFDGKGYPTGLRGDQIPIVGRIVSIVDVFDALISERPYREAMPVPKAIGILEDAGGSQLDAGILDLFLGHSDRFVSIAAATMELRSG